MQVVWINDIYRENEILINSKKPVIVECFLIPPYSIYTQFNSYILVSSLVNVVKNIQDKKRLRETEKKKPLVSGNFAWYYSWLLLLFIFLCFFFHYYYLAIYSNFCFKSISIIVFFDLSIKHWLNEMLLISIINGIASFLQYIYIYIFISSIYHYENNNNLYNHINDCNKILSQ